MGNLSFLMLLGSGGGVPGTMVHRRRYHCRYPLIYPPGALKCVDGCIALSQRYALQIGRYMARVVAGVLIVSRMPDDRLELGGRATVTRPAPRTARRAKARIRITSLQVWEASLAPL